MYEKAEELGRALEQRAHPRQLIAEAFPGIHDFARAFLTEDQERELLQLAGSNTQVYSVGVALAESHLISQTRALGQVLEQAGRIVSYTCNGFTPEGQVSFLYLLAGDDREHRLVELLHDFSVRIQDARKASSEPPSPPAAEEPVEESAEIARIMQELRTRYLADFPKQLDRLNAMLSQVADDRGNRTLIDDLFRFGHSLKGIGGTYGFWVLTHLAAAFEEVLAAVRAGTMPMSTELIGLLHEWADALSSVIRELRAGSFSKGRAYPILNRLRAVLHPHTVAPGGAQEREYSGGGGLG